MLTIVYEELEEGEFGALYEEGGDAVLMVNRGLSDDVRGIIINKLLCSVSVRVRPHRYPALVPPSAQQAGIEHGVPGSPAALRLAH